MTDALLAPRTPAALPDTALRDAPSPDAGVPEAGVHDASAGDAEADTGATAVVVPAPAEALTSAEALHARFDEVLQHALRRQLWTFFVDDDLVGFPLVVPCEGVPVRPVGPALATYLDALVDIGAKVGARRAVLVLERPGPATLRSSDRAWIDALTGGLRHRHLVLHAVLVCSDDGVEVVAGPADRDAQPAGDPPLPDDAAEASPST